MVEDTASKSCTTGVKENPETGRETSRKQADLMAGNYIQW